MNVRYCEIFFDPQGHTRTGVTWETMMCGFRAAQEDAEKRLGVSCETCSAAKMIRVLTTFADRSKVPGSSASYAMSLPSLEWSTISPPSLTAT